MAACWTTTRSGCSTVKNMWPTATANATPPHYAGANRERRGNTSPFVYNRETLGFRLDSREEIALFRDGTAPK